MAPERESEKRKSRSSALDSSYTASRSRNRASKSKPVKTLSAVGALGVAESGVEVSRRIGIASPTQHTKPVPGGTLAPVAGTVRIWAVQGRAPLPDITGKVVNAARIRLPG